MILNKSQDFLFFSSIWVSNWGTRWCYFPPDWVTLSPYGLIELGKFPLVDFEIHLPFYGILLRFHFFLPHIVKSNPQYIYYVLKIVFLLTMSLITLCNVFLLYISIICCFLIVACRLILLDECHFVILRWGTRFSGCKYRCIFS